MKESEQTVRALSDTITDGELSDAILAEHMTAWTTTPGQAGHVPGV